jgi:hypothetical protein
MLKERKNRECVEMDSNPIQERLSLIDKKFQEAKIVEKLQGTVFEVGCTVLRSQ